MRMMDLFSGAGGLSLGLERAGFESVMAVEWDADASETYSREFPHSNLIHGAIQDIDFRSWVGHVELLAGGPPCQPFSNGGKRLAQQDSRDMLPEFLRVVRQMLPPMFLMENVAGLVQGRRRAYFDAVRWEFEKLGYTVTLAVLNAADYGVPQKRVRLFVVGSLIGTFAFPKPTHGTPSQPHIPVSFAIDGNRVIGEANPSKVTYAKNPDLRPSPYDGHLFNGGGRPLHLKRPAPTILASAGGNKTHFIDTYNLVPGYHRSLVEGLPPQTGAFPGGRRLTVQESAALQTFPAGMEFAGSKSSQYRQIGNAVPPLLATVIGRQLMSVFGRVQSEAMVAE